MIQRTLEEHILPLLGGSKAVILMGARQVGKSTLLHQMLGDKTDSGSRVPPRRRENDIEGTVR